MTDSMEKRIKQLEDRLHQLEVSQTELARLKAYRDIANLQGRYNHLVLGHHWEKIIDELFAKETPGIMAQIAESGEFRGIDGVRRVFIEMLGKLYNYDGNCAVHELTTPVIEVSKDATTAQGMWYTWGPNTFKDPAKGVIAIWQVLKFFHDFVKENGEWRIHKFRGILVFRSAFEKGWVKEPYIQGSTIKGPDNENIIASDAPGTVYPIYDPNGQFAGLPFPPDPVR